MGVSVLVLGYSGSGKSSSLRNFEQGEIGVLNVASKPLPFRGKLDIINSPTYGACMQALQRNDRRAYVIDDANYLMAFENFRRAKEKGFDKFVDMALHFEQLLECANSTDDDTIVYFLMHPDMDDSGHIKPKTIGKMLDNQLTVEGMFPIVLLAERSENGFEFVTQTDGFSPTKAPIDMFSEARIENDLKAVDAAIRDYWDLAPLVDPPKKGAKDGSTN